MRYLLSLAAVALFAMGCGNNVVSSTGSGSTGGTGSGTTTGGTSGATTGGATTGGSNGSSGTTGAALPRPNYPAPSAPPYAIGSVIANMTFTGYVAPTSGTRIDQVPGVSWGDFDLQKVRNLVDASGHPYKYVLLDFSAGWCGPCNDEAESFGLNADATNTGKIALWEQHGGLYLTVLVQGQDSNPPLQGDVTTWLTTHNVQSSLAGDFQNIWMTSANQTAFPGNVIVDLDTMAIVDVFYGVQDQNIFTEFEHDLGIQ